jgi:hypothetical protein
VGSEIVWFELLSSEQQESPSAKERLSETRPCAGVIGAIAEFERNLII